MLFLVAPHPSEGAIRLDIGVWEVGLCKLPCHFARGGGAPCSAPKATATPLRLKHCCMLVSRQGLSLHPLLGSGAHGSIANLQKHRAFD